MPFPFYKPPPYQDNPEEAFPSGVVGHAGWQNIQPAEERRGPHPGTVLRYPEGGGPDPANGLVARWETVPPKE